MKKCTEYTLGKTIISSDYDDNADFEFYGSYGNRYQPGCIVVRDGSFYEDHIDDEEYEPSHMHGGDYSFFYPADNGEKAGTPDYRKYAMEDYQRMVDYDNQHWSYLIIKVETHIHTDSGLSDSVYDVIGGVESDGGKDYIKEMIDDLKCQVKEQLKKMGFSEDEINASVDNAELKKGEMYL